MNLKQKIILFGLAFILILTTVGAIFLLDRTTKGGPENTAPTDTPRPTGVQPRQEQTGPPVKYDSSAFREVVERMKNRMPLANNDLTIRNEIAASIEESPGVVFENNNVRVEYLISPDIFQGEVLTTDFETAKNEAVQFFTSRGMSREGVCNLPLSFYLNYDVTQSLRGTNTVFNPLPPGC